MRISYSVSHTLNVIATSQDPVECFLAEGKEWGNVEAQRPAAYARLLDCIREGEAQYAP